MIKKERPFIEHFSLLTGFGNPIDFQAEYNLVSGNDQWKLWVTIQKQVVKSVHFSGPQKSFWSPFFSLLCERVINIPIHEAMLLGWKNYIQWIEESALDEDEEAVRFLNLENDGYLPFVCLPAFMLTKALVEFLGGDLNLQKIKGLEAKDLVCHCFGTTRLEISDFVTENPQADLALINGKLLAGSACGECQEDCLFFLNTKKELKELVEGFFLDASLMDTYQGKKQYDFLKQVGTLIVSYEKDQCWGGDVKIKSLRDRFLTLNVSLVGEQKKALENHLFEKTGFRLFIRS